MIALALPLLAGFAYLIEVDPFTDERTHVARFGNRDRGPSLSVECGAATEGKLAVVVDPGRLTFSPDFPMLARYMERVRFDDQPAIELGFRYNGEFAALTGRDAQTFIASMKQSSKVLLEVRSRGGDNLHMTVPLEGASDSVARVEANCTT